MIGFLRLILSFTRREFHIATSYRFQFAFQILNIVFMLAVFFFVARLLPADALEQSRHAHTTDYFSFVLVGIASTTFLETAIKAFPERLRQTMTEGSLEMMFTSPVQPVWIMGLPAVWNFLFQGFRASVVLACGVLVFGAELPNSNIPATVVVVLVSCVAYSVIGLFSVAAIMVWKRGDPIAWAATQAAAVVGGAYFPIELLPRSVQSVASILPMTHAFRATRATLLSGHGVGDVAHEIGFLLAFSAVFVPLGVWCCNAGVRRAKREGNLSSF